MALIPLIHILLMQVENFIVWLGGKMGFSFWSVVIFSVILFLIFYRKIFNILMILLNKLGVK